MIKVRILKGFEIDIWKDNHTYFKWNNFKGQIIDGIKLIPKYQIFYIKINSS
jgi:hypothetical protein